MTTEEIAARHSSVPGYTLIDVAEVALPIWRIEVEALVIAKKEVALVDEFILRSIGAGLSSVSQLSGFLGLNEKFLRRRLSGLMSSDCVLYGRVAGAGGASLSLTAKGVKSLSTLREETARREVLAYLYDGISRHLITLPRGGEVLRRPKEIQAWGLVEVPPLPGTPPTDETLRAQDFNSCIPSQIRKRSRIHQVLSLERIGQRQKYFREARMLVYKGSSGEDLKVSFFSVHGRPLPEIDAAFTKKGGVQRLNLPRQINDSREALAHLAKDPLVSAGIAAEQRITPAAKRKAEEAARDNTLLASKIGEAEQKLKDPETETEAQSLKKEVEQLREQLAVVQKQQSKTDLRRLTVYEHPAVLDRALRDTSKRMMLVSPWISDDVMNDRRIEAIHVLASRNVEVYIGYGIDDTNDRRAGKDKDPEDTRAYKELKELSRKYPTLHLVRLGNTHAKLLLMDSTFAVAGSFNWMSFKGDKKRQFREEISYMTTDKDFVDQQFEYHLQRFEESAPTQRPRHRRR
ncbi:MAG: hypothetical protein FGM15_08990 [Chthoniobacterales bacterium]|nr:hypothetical protein [Chthoniobacterales bacterium]